MDVRPQENQMTLAMVARNLGITILPELDLLGRTPPQNLRAIPLKEHFTRTVCLLCSRGSERPPLATTFLQVIQKTVEEWREVNLDRAENWKRK